MAQTVSPSSVLSLVEMPKFQTEDYPRGEQFYTDALSVFALSAVFAPQQGERK